MATYRGYKKNDHITQFVSSDSVRELVFSRDNYKCLRCSTSENLTYDHVLPRSRGGNRTLENGQTLCDRCNTWKADRELDYRNPYSKIIHEVSFDRKPMQTYMFRFGCDDCEYGNKFYPYCGICKKPFFNTLITNEKPPKIKRKKNPKINNPKPKESPKRIRIYNRDGNKCLCCGSEDNLTLDHVIPKSKGGSSEDENLQTLCSKCNGKKADTTISYRDPDRHWNFSFQPKP